MLRRPPLTSGQQFLVIPNALGDLELKGRKMNGLIAELDTIVIPIIACGGNNINSSEEPELDWLFIFSFEFETKSDRV